MAVQTDYITVSRSLLKNAQVCIWNQENTTFKQNGYNIWKKKNAKMVTIYAQKEYEFQPFLLRTDNNFCFLKYFFIINLRLYC